MTLLKFLRVTLVSCLLRPSVDHIVAHWGDPGGCGNYIKSKVAIVTSGPRFDKGL